MAKTKVKLSRSAPKRTITKQQAVRHLIHSAVRMICAGEDPFAIQLLVQSADKLLIDLAKKTKRKLPFAWGEFVKPQYENAVIATIRETSNFFKHADKDHDAALHVVDIALMNILQLSICVVNYAALFGEWTDHMKLAFFIGKVIHPDGFVRPDERERFDAAFVTVQNMNLASFLSGWWNNRISKLALPNLDREKAEDLQDTQPLYGMGLSDIPKA
ncbi:MAG: hypothetical protein WAK55_25555 [Xanthobacteraceae bacterium]